jgi:hypothetical protein
MNTFEITYYDWQTIDGRRKLRRHVVGQQTARNGIAAIRALLEARGVTADEMSDARSLGSNKRLTLAGITFEANKVRA